MIYTLHCGNVLYMSDWYFRHSFIKTYFGKLAYLCPFCKRIVIYSETLSRWLGGDSMPTINVIAAEDIPAPKPGREYKVKSAEEFKSAVRNFAGIRVVLDGREGEVIESLWIREIVGKNSKLGAFIKALGKNTDKWQGKKIFFKTWGVGQREIEVR